jgi:hypothetical protein
MGLKQILAPVFVWVPESPLDPGFGVTPPIDPGYGIGTLPHPGHGLPGGGHISTGPIYGGGHPSQGLPGGGHISTGPIYGGGHPGNKPPGRPVLPPSPDNGLPPGRPPYMWGGRWEIVDPGWGKPPLLVFFPIDPGFGMEETPPPGADNSLPGGVYLPCDPDYGMPERPCGGKPRPPLWGWLPEPPDLSKPLPVPPAQPK